MLFRHGLAAAVLATAALSAPARADMVQFHATLSGAAEVPPKTTAGTGDAKATLDTNTKALTYIITYSGLSGPATMAHFHGPAATTANANVVVPFKNPVTSPITGSATLTDAQIADLMAGKWYANVHTAANPAGEIRGQMMH
ncbi:CHRD domain-containing protein [Limobrevibacterium gyesilva]|uniref:CHRD domain-containing protein n=1 Tax=Limobrevibacterium gyesilva TaxID=2991712 RepID=A0AA41YP12_9PROT|nr:CHRD domain-containing protein [Limobrevibacterium gyesilva]MCW3477069.1 CHRD domain-containing protein [Limobrevibacterium gyesilva]